MCVRCLCFGCTSNFQVLWTLVNPLEVKEKVTTVAVKGDQVHGSSKVLGIKASERQSKRTEFSIQPQTNSKSNQNKPNQTKSTGNEKYVPETKSRHRASQVILDLNLCDICKNS